MAMSRPQPVSVLLVASTSAALHGGVAVLSVPILSFILLCWNGTPGHTNAFTEAGMVIALLSPLIAAGVGFVAGALMAFAHNVFAHDQRRLSLGIGEAREVRAASFSNVA